MNRLMIFVAAALLSASSASADLGPRDPNKQQYSLKPSAKPAPPSKPAPPPQPSTSSREPVVVARQNPAIAELLKQARGAGKADAPANPKTPTVDESVIQVPLGGQCGFAGCSSQTLVAFTFRTRGANPATNAVLVLVSCESVATIPCTAVTAEVRATSSPNATK